MTPSIHEPLKNWFGYSRRERRSTFILLILIVAIIGIRFVLPERQFQIEDVLDEPGRSFGDTLPNKKISVLSPGQKVGRARMQPEPLLNINTCDSSALEKLPGIGPVLSARIVKYRNLLGGYASIEQLKEVYGLTGETYELISGKIIANPGAVRKIKINSVDYKGLIRLPYFERFEVTAILKYRELNGRIENIGDMIDNKLITNDKAVKVKPYLEFGE